MHHAQVYLYYELDSYYANHKRYVRSRDDNQLAGALSQDAVFLVLRMCGGVVPLELHVMREAGCPEGHALARGAGVAGTRCTRISGGHDLRLNIAGDGSGSSKCAPQQYVGGQPNASLPHDGAINPCGLIAWSFFNDSYTAAAVGADGVAAPLQLDVRGRQRPLLLPASQPACLCLRTSLHASLQALSGRLWSACMQGCMLGSSATSPVSVRLLGWQVLGGG